MTITLPRLPRNAKCLMRPIRNATVQRSGVGGARLPIVRTGDHWAIEVETGPLSVLWGRSLMADVLSGTSEPVRVLIPQPGVDTGAPGSPRINGADQAGSTVDLDGLTPWYVIRKGQFLTIVTGGEGRAYMATAEVIADASGEASVPIWPMLHVEPANNDSVEIAEPWIEGLIDDGGDHDVGLLPLIEPDSFTIEEQD